MAAANTGTLIILSIPDDSRREQIIDYLCTFTKGTVREAVAARLEKLPLTLGATVPAEVGNKILSTLQNLGAEVTFTCSDADRSVAPAVPPAHTERQPEPPPAMVSEAAATRNAARPAQPKPTVKPGSGNNDIRKLVTILLVLMGGLCGATVIFMPALKAASDPDVLLNKFLLKNAEINNKTCPRDINQHLRLDRFEAGDKKMTINYTLLEYESTEVNGNELRPSVSRDIREGVCREEGSAALIKKGVAFVFAVHGKDGGLIFDYQVAQKDCDL
jgi:hypothetical protein